MSQRYFYIQSDIDEYPYRVGLNTLKHIGATFNPDNNSGLSYLLQESVFNTNSGDKLCIIIIPKDAKTGKVYDRFKSDKIIIEKIMSLGDVRTAQYLNLLWNNNGIDRYMRWACKSGHFDIVQYFVSVNSSIVNNFHLHIAVANGHLEIAQYLVSMGATKRRYTLALSAENGHLNAVRYLVESLGANVRCYDDITIRTAAYHGHLDIVQYLVSMGADIHSCDDYALRISAYKGHFTIVQYLVSLGADIHAHDDYAIRWATENGHLEIAQYIQEHIQQEYNNIE